MNKNKGFTLIELLIVIAIIAALVAYALPNYRQYVLRSQRSEAINALMQVSQMQERHYANTNRYGTSAELNLSAVFPAPAADNDLNYLIEMVSNDTSYTITATAQKTQIQDTSCVAFTLNNLGVRTPATGCWD